MIDADWCNGSTADSDSVSRGSSPLSVVFMLETELKDTDHKLVLRISKKKNPASQGTECQIRNFVVNDR